MEELPLETSCDCDDNVINTVQVSVEEYEQLTESLNWHAAILAVLLEEAGGAVEVKREDLADIKLTEARAAISYIEETDKYLIERVVTEDES